MRKTKYLNRLFLDFFIVTICFIVSRLIFPYNQNAFSARGFTFYIYLILLWYFSSQVTNLYDDFIVRPISKEILTTIGNILLHVGFIIIILFFASRNPLEAKSFISIYLLLLILIIPIVKYITRWYYSNILKANKKATSILVIGAGEVGMNFRKIIQNRFPYQYKIQGFLDDNAKDHLNGDYLGTIDDIKYILQQKDIQEVVVALPNIAIEKIKYIVKVSEQNGKRVSVIPDYFGFATNLSVSNFGPLPIIQIRKIPLDEQEARFFKRLFDIIFSLVVIIFLFSWLFPIIAFCVKVNSRGNVFFKQERWGLNNKKIICYKFRSMVNSSVDVDNQGKYHQASKNDARVTKVGSFLRKSNIDELPQFFNVLKGEMSIVGPRPHPTPLNMQSKDIVDNYNLRHLVKPGITGWAQVNGYRGETNTHSMQKRIDFDIWYIDNWNFWLDCQIIIQTIINMIKGEQNAY